MAIPDRLLPKVRKLQEKECSFKLSNPIIIGQDSTSEITLRTAKILEQDLRKATGYDVRITNDSTGAILLKTTTCDNPEAYNVSVNSDGVVIEGAGDAGVFYGTRTLLQLIDDNAIPCCEIEDNPDYKHRMVHYDMARDQTCNMQHLKHVIDILSDHKVNMLHLYFENRFQFKKHPEVSVPGVMTPEQARELDDYAYTRFIELVPEVNCLAHLEQALSVEKYKHLSEDQSEPYEICIHNPEAVQFVKDLVDEVVPCFKTQYFHMGGDESSQMGTCPKCAERLEKDGNKVSMYAEHFTHMAEYIKSLGKRPMIWGDMLLHYRGAAEMMPKDIIIFDWHYGETTVDTVTYFTSQGYEVYVCPAMSGFSRIAAPYKHATGNISKFIGEGSEGGAIGECTCAWELRLGHLFMNDLWGILLSADKSWNPDNWDMADYEKRFCKEFFGLEEQSILKYYDGLHDGYHKIYPGLMNEPHSWTAFANPSREHNAKFGPQVTSEMLAKSDEYYKWLMDTLDKVKANVKKNMDTLEFADLPAHTTRMMLRKFAFAYQADVLIDEAKEMDAADQAEADIKIWKAIDMLKEIDADMDYFARRFPEIVERFGGSIDDVKRISDIKNTIAGRIADAKALMTE